MSTIDREQWEKFIAGGMKAQAAVDAALPKRRPKYGNTKTFVLADLRIWPADDGPLPPGACKFDSKKEAERFVELSLQQREGKIDRLALQVSYGLGVIDRAGVRHEIARYVADFSYVRDGTLTIEDVKSPASKTPLYELKRKMMRAEHGIEIVEL